MTVKFNKHKQSGENWLGEKRRIVRGTGVDCEPKTRIVWKSNKVARAVREFIAKTRFSYKNYRVRIDIFTLVYKVFEGIRISTP